MSDNHAHARARARARKRDEIGAPDETQVDGSHAMVAPVTPHRLVRRTGVTNDEGWIDGKPRSSDLAAQIYMVMM